jgi:hypothetical protein
MVGDQNAYTPVLEVHDQVLDVHHAMGSMPGEGLVEQHEGRRGGRARQISSAGARRRRASRPAAWPGGRIPSSSSSSRARALLARVEAQGLEDGQDVLLGGELAEDAGLLRQVADARAGRWYMGRAVMSSSPRKTWPLSGRARPTTM